MLVVATQHTKQISIDDLVVGMYIVGLDQPWLQSPFLLHRRRIGRHAEIARLKAYGVRRVTIDPTRGLDLVETLPPPAEDFLPFVNLNLSHFSPHLHDRLTTNPAGIIARTMTQHGHQDTQESVANIA
jgi:hypothetical protein